MTDDPSLDPELLAAGALVFASSIQAAVDPSLSIGYSMEENQNQGTAPEPVESSMSDVEAFGQIVAALRGLDSEAQLRVLRSVTAFFSIPLASAQPGTRPALYAAEAGPPALSGGHANASFSEDRTPTPKEFILEKRPIQDIERIACLAYYLAHYRDTPHFKTLDLSKLNTEAAQIKFSNAAQAVDNATKAGLLVSASRGHKQLSALGELYVEALPDRQAAKETIAHARPRRRKNRSRASNAGDANGGRIGEGNGDE